MKYRRKMKFGILMEEPPKPKEKNFETENFAPGGPKCGMENSMFNLHG
jgi:hypothetical protein